MENRFRKMIEKERVRHIRTEKESESDKTGKVIKRI